MGSCGMSVSLHDVSSYQASVPRSCQPEAQRPLPPAHREEGGHVRHQKVCIYQPQSCDLEARTLGEVSVTVWALGRPCLRHCRETADPWCHQHDPVRALDAFPSQGLCKMGQTVPLGGDKFLPGEGGFQGPELGAQLELQGPSASSGRKGPCH